MYHNICVNGLTTGLVVDIEGAAVIDVAGAETAEDGAGAATAGEADNRDLTVD